MRTKRIVSLLLCLIMALSLLPAAAFATKPNSTSITITMDVPVIGKPLPTTATVAESYLEVARLEWEPGSEKDTAKKKYAIINVRVKADADFRIGSGSIAFVNGEEASYFGGGDEVTVRYTFDLSETQEAAAIAAAVNITIAEPAAGKPLPTTATVAESYLQVKEVVWRDTIWKGTPADVAHIWVQVKPGSGFAFTKENLSAKVNGKDANPYYGGATEAEIVYIFLRSDSGYIVPRANPINVTYDTFDYRAYANIYPDLKAAYGYDAQKLWAHYVNYGRDEGRVAFAISASDNPKSGAAIYKDAAVGTAYGNDGHNYSADVPATYLDTLPPDDVSLSYDPWRLYQLTRPQNMSNAKLVAEWYRLQTLLNTNETGFTYPLVTMDRRSELSGELSARSRLFEAVYCYENGARSRVSSYKVETAADVAGLKSNEEYKRAAQTDGIILIQWLYTNYYDSEERLFPRPPADPGTAGNTLPGTSTTPSTPAVPATGTAYASTQTWELDGKKVTFQTYALKDANGNPTQYVKIRDLALALNDTAARFSVDWDGSVNIVTGKAYAPNGSENKTPFSGDRAYKTPTSPANVNGKASDLQAIVLTDDSGGQYNYYKFRDLGRALGFNVGWTSARGSFIETGKPYTDAD